MYAKLKWKVQRLLRREKKQIPVGWVRKGNGAWLPGWLIGPVIKPKDCPRRREIERIASRTNRLGPQPLWKGYPSQKSGGATRYYSSGDVRTKPRMGNLYAHLVSLREPEVIVEFGTAFGVSGMYWLAGLESVGQGELLTFEPNEVWAAIARENLARISGRFTLTVGTFEDNIDQCLGDSRRIDLAFIDGIHTSEFVIPQLELVIERASPKALIVLDDIGHSPDMADCWRTVSHDPRFAASAALGERVGILELAS